MINTFLISFFGTILMALLIVYYVALIGAHSEKIKTKSAFLFSLIPFGYWLIILKMYYRKLK